MILILSLTLLAILGYTIYSLTNHNNLYQEAEEIARTIPRERVASEHKSLGLIGWIFFLGGALLTGSFAVQFFSGSDDPSTWTTAQYVYAGMGIVVTIAITSAQKALYGSIHTGKAALLITFLILLFVIVSEIATSSERTDLLIKHRSENSATYQATNKAINAPTLPANLNTQGLAEAQANIARANVEIAACERHRSKGQARVDKCLRIERGNLAAAQGAFNAISNQNSMLSDDALRLKLAMIDKAKHLQYDEEQSPAIVKFMRSLFGGVMLHSMILLSLIVVVAFESGFHFTQTRRAVLNHALILIDGIPTPEKSIDENKKPASTWNNELSKSGIDSPADDALNQHADSEQINRIIERGTHAPHAHVDPLQVASDAPVGTMVSCPECGGEFKKRNKQHRFCCAKHRDTWHNKTNPTKQDFLKQRNMQTA